MPHILEQHKKIIITQNIKVLFNRKETFLNRADMRIFSAGSNEEALEIHRAEKADLIIANLDAPSLSGELLCSAIRESEELCRVSLIIIHPGSPSDFLRISECRANAFIEQSADPAVLLDKMHQLINIPVRETYRAPIGVRLHCKGTRIPPSLGYTENISLTGMLFDAEDSFSKSEVIWCWFVLPDSTHVRTNAEVVRVVDKASEHDTNQYGIRFIDLADEYRTAIETYVRQKQHGP
jgi:CheY-like chemotaxis protein